MYLLAPQRPFVQLTTLTLSGKIKLLELLKPFTTVKGLSYEYFLNQFGHKRSQHRSDMGGQTSPPPISKYFNKKRIPSGIRTHDLPHDSPRR